MDNFSSIIDEIYAAPVDPQKWSIVLDELARVGGAKGAALLVERSDEWIGWRVSESLEPAASHHFSKNRIGIGIAPSRLKAMNRAGFVADHEEFSDSEYRALPFVRDFAIPNNLYHSAGTVIDTPHGDWMLFCLYREAGAAPFGRDELEKLDYFRPHLARAAMLASRWGLEKVKLSIDALVNISLPAVVINSERKLIASNKLFDGFERFVSIDSKKTLDFESKASSLIL